MSTTVTALTDSLLSDVPKLNPSGVNWAIFEFRFLSAVKAKGKWDHFDGSTPIPVLASQTEPTAEETTEINKWRKDEATAINLLLQKILTKVTELRGKWSERGSICEGAS